MSQRQRLERAAKYERVLYRLRARSSYYYEVGKAGKRASLLPSANCWQLRCGLTAKRSVWLSTTPLSAGRSNARITPSVHDHPVRLHRAAFQR